MKKNKGAKAILREYGFTRIQNAGHWMGRRGNLVPVILVQRPCDLGWTIGGDRRQLGRQLKELAADVVSLASSAVLWYGTKEAVLAALAQGDEDLLDELNRLAEPTYRSLAAAKSAAHDCLWEEAKRRGIVA